MCVSHFACFSVFLAIFQFLQCAFLIFHVSQCFSPFSRSYSVCFLIFHVFRCFLPYSMSYLILHVFQFSRHNTIPTVWISNILCFSLYLAILQVQECVCVCVCVCVFARFSVFLAIFNVLPCEVLIFLICQVPRYIPGPTIWISQFPCWSFFLPYLRSYSGHFSFF